MPGVSHSVLTAYGPQDGTHAPTLGQVTVLLAVTILPRPLPSMRHDCPVCGRRSPEKRAKNRKTTGKRENHQPRMSLINGAVSSFFLVYCFFFCYSAGGGVCDFFFSTRRLRKDTKNAADQDRDRYSHARLPTSPSPAVLWRSPSFLASSKPLFYVLFYVKYYKNAIKTISAIVDCNC